MLPRVYQGLPSPRRATFLPEAPKISARMRRYPEVSTFILAGGASIRMGTEKALLEFGSEPLIKHTARVLEPLVGDVVVVGRPELYSALGLRAIPDKFVGQACGSEPVRASLVGIFTALTSTASDWNFILACDLPYLTREWVDWLLTRAVASRCQIVMPRTSRGLEPLAAVYRRECATAILAALKSGIRKVTDALAGFEIEFVEEMDWREFDPEHRVLKNMNKPEDYREAQRWWKSRNGAT